MNREELMSAFLEVLNDRAFVAAVRNALAVPERMKSAKAKESKGEGKFDEVVKIISCEVSNGVKPDGDPWTRFNLQWDHGGRKYYGSTFDDYYGGVAEASIEYGTSVRMQWEPDRNPKYGQKIWEIDAAEGDAPSEEKPVHTPVPEEDIPF